MWCRICRQDVPVSLGHLARRSPARAAADVWASREFLGGRAAELEAVADGGIDLTGNSLSK